MSLNNIVADCLALKAQIAENVAILVIERARSILYLFNTQATVELSLLCLTVNQYSALVRQRNGRVPKT